MYKKFKELNSMSRYILVGGLSFAIELGFLAAFKYLLDLSVSLSVAIAFWIGLLASFSLQKLLAFQDHRKSAKVVTRQVILYAALVLFNYVFTLALVSLSPPELFLITRTVALIVTTLWNYVVYKYLIFSPSPKSKSSLQKPIIIRDYLNLQNVLTFSSLLLLGAVSAYGAYKASFVLAFNADAVGNVYLVSEGIQQNQIHLLAQHSNLLKFPLFLLQSKFDYNYHSFVAVNIATYILSIGLWVYLLTKIVGKRYLSIISATLSLSLLLSVLFNLNFAYTTVRNIEYPLCLLFLYFLIKFIYKPPARLKNLWPLLLSSILLTLVLASDKYFQYIFVLPLGVMLVVLALAYKNLRKRSIYGLLLLGGSQLIALSIVAAMGASKYFIYDTASELKVMTVAIEDFLPSVGVAIQQVLGLTGSNIFDKPLDQYLIGAAISLLLILVALIGYTQVAKNGLHKIRQAKQLDTQQVYGLVLGLILITSFAIYVMSGQVILRDETTGEVINRGQERYLTIIPLLIPLGVVFAIQKLKLTVRTIQLVTISLIAVTGICILGIGPKYGSAFAQTNNVKHSVDSINQTLKEENTDVVLTGYWYGPLLRFWSDDRVEPAHIRACNITAPFLKRNDWYAANPNIRSSAIIIDTTGIDKEYLGCNKQALLNIYGVPQKTREATGTSGNVQIWFYDYDVRTKVKDAP